MQNRRVAAIVSAVAGMLSEDMKNHIACVRALIDQLSSVNGGVR